MAEREGRDSAAEAGWEDSPRAGRFIRAFWSRGNLNLAFKRVWQGRVVAWVWEM